MSNKKVIWRFRQTQVFIAALGICIAISHTSLSQKKYYEFNNPEALKINQKRLALLTSGQWEGKDLLVLIRGEESAYKNTKQVTYRPDGTYSANSVKGKWEIKYNRYLVHTIDNVSEHESGNARNPLTGIYSITSLNDSSLTLTKIQSSAQDMIWVMSFIKPTEQSADASNVLGHLNPFSGRTLSTQTIDSISYLSKEELFIHNISVQNDIALVKTADSLYAIKLNLEDPLRRVKVFQENEVISYRVVPKRYTLPEDQLHTVDSLALSWIKANSKAIAPPHMDSYFRQYIGYEDAQGNRIILLNAFETYHVKWREDIVQNTMEFKGFRIFVNLTKKECFGLYVRD